MQLLCALRVLMLCDMETRVGTCSVRNTLWSSHGAQLRCEMSCTYSSRDATGLHGNGHDACISTFACIVLSFNVICMLLVSESTRQQRDSHNLSSQLTCGLCAKMPYLSMVCGRLQPLFLQSSAAWQLGCWLYLQMPACNMWQDEVEA